LSIRSFSPLPQIFIPSLPSHTLLHSHITLTPYTLAQHDKGELPNSRTSSNIADFALPGLIPTIPSSPSVFVAPLLSRPQILAILYDGGKHAEEQPKLLGTTENALGLKDWAKEKGFEFIVTSDKEGPNSEFQKHIVDADILITYVQRPLDLFRFELTFFRRFATVLLSTLVTSRRN